MMEIATGPSELWVVEGVDHGIATRGIPEANFREYESQILSFLTNHAPNCLAE